jgi:hypothetical protein
VDAPAFEPRENRVAAPRHRAATAGDAGHRARLGRSFLQVPPPSPTSARCLPSLALLAVVSHPVLAAAVARHRHVRVRVRARVRASNDAPRSSAPQHARALALEARLGLWPFSCAGPRVCTPVGRAAMASPWRDASLTRTQRRDRCPLDRRVHALPPAAASTHACLCPAAVVFSAATHGAGLSSAAPPVFNPCRA